MRSTRALDYACAQRDDPRTRQLSDPDVRPLRSATSAQPWVPFPRTDQRTLVIKADIAHTSTTRIPRS